jgi:aspartate-semialdehyde dehydrogenase
MVDRMKVAVCGACGSTIFGWIAQMVLCDLEDHPYFEVAGMVAEQSIHVGRTFAQAKQEWFENRPLRPEYEALRMLPPDGAELREEGIGLVISCLPPARSQKLDGQLAETGMAVVSESPGWRGEDDVPLVVPEINPDHLSVIPAQQEKRGWKGFIVSNPACTITILALSLKPLVDAFGVKRVLLTTLQALSGAGWTGIPSMAIIDNVIPYIVKEEEKLRDEGAKILGRLEVGRVKSAGFEISATCTRVPVLHGHMGAMFVECARAVTVEEVVAVMRGFAGLAQELDLPTAPQRPLVVRDEPDRPQPRLDRDTRAVTVGRIRLDPATPNGIKYVVLGHNSLRGTVGNTLLNAELLYKKGLIG